MKIWKTTIGDHVFGALIGGLLWWMASHIPAFKQQAEPFDNVFLWMGAGALVVFVAELVESRRRQAHWQAHSQPVAELSRQLGFTWKAEISRDEVPALPLFTNWVSGSDCMQGEKNGVAFQIFDLTAREPRHHSAPTNSDKYNGSFTVFVGDASGLPDFTLRPKNLGLRLIALMGMHGETFDTAGIVDPVESEAVVKFGKQHSLMTTDKNTDPVAPAYAENRQGVRRLFSPQSMNLCNRHIDCSIVVRGGHMAVWRGNRILPSEQRTELLNAALEIQAGLLVSLQNSNEKAALPERPGRDMCTQRNRYWSSLIGGFFGLFPGFFAFAILNLRTDLFFPCMGFGALVGAWSARCIYLIWRLSRRSD